MAEERRKQETDKAELKKRETLVAQQAETAAAAKVEADRLAAEQQKREDEARQVEIARLQVLKDDAARREADVAAKTKETASKEMTLDLGGGVKMEFAKIPAGTFDMGSPWHEKLR